MRTTPMGYSWIRRGTVLLIAICAALTTVSLWPHSAYAADQSASLKIKDMRVSVWPEYDDPRLLVLYQGEFTGDQKFPQKVRFLVPKGVMMNMVCAVTDSGEHQCQRYEAIDLGDYTAIDYTLPLSKFALEYYADSIVGQTSKSIDYRFMPPYPIEKLEIEAQKPLKATDFQTDPQPASTVKDSQGFEYSLFDYTNVATDKPVEFKVSYAKQDSKPSVEKKQNSTAPTSSGSGSATTVPSTSGFDANMFVLPLFGLLIAGGVGYWLASKLRATPAAAGFRGGPKGGRSTSQRQAPTAGGTSKAAKRRSTADAGGVSDNTARKIAYCTQCGEPLVPGSSFCGTCGTKVKKT